MPTASNGFTSGSGERLPSAPKGWVFGYVPNKPTENETCSEETTKIPVDKDKH